MRSTSWPPRCPRCGYHLTRMALGWSCDACVGAVPKPAKKILTGEDKSG